jgi:putative NADH-flavin reductase
MRLFVLGATGKTGGALVVQGLARGHAITTFGRKAFDGKGQSLTVAVGNTMSANDLSAVLPGTDAVLSLLGTRGMGPTSVLDHSVQATIEAMHRTGVRRLVIISSLLLDSNLGWLPRLMGQTVLRHHVRDQLRMEKHVVESGLDWTVLRAPRLNDTALTTRFTASPDSELAAKAVPMSREDLAFTMLDTAEQGTQVQQIVRLSGGRI